MKLTAVSGIMLTLLLISMLTLAFKIIPVKAKPRIVLVVTDPTFTELYLYDFTKPFYDRLLSNGYVVDVISHSEISTSNFSSYGAAVIHWDVTYITEPKNYSNLLSSGIGFVFMSADVEKAGLGNTTGATSYGLTVNIVNNTHYITRPFSIGNVEVYSEPLYRDYMQRAPDTLSLANISEGDIIVVKNKQVYFGLDYGAGLTLDGWKLFDRSIEFVIAHTPPVVELLAPYIGLTILLAVAVVTVVYVKKKKRKTELSLKQPMKNQLEGV